MDISSRHKDTYFPVQIKIICFISNYHVCSKMEIPVRILLYNIKMIIPVDINICIYFPVQIKIICFNVNHHVCSKMEIPVQILLFYHKTQSSNQHKDIICIFSSPDKDKIIKNYINARKWKFQSKNLGT